MNNKQNNELDEILLDFLVGHTDTKPSTWEKHDFKITKTKILDLLFAKLPRESKGKPILLPCPEGREGCLVAHYSKELYIQDFDKGFNKYRDEVLSVIESMRND